MHRGRNLEYPQLRRRHPLIRDDDIERFDAALELSGSPPALAVDHHPVRERNERNVLPDEQRFLQRRQLGKAKRLARLIRIGLEPAEFLFFESLHFASVF